MVHRTRTWRHAIAILVALMGGANILSSVIVRAYGREHLIRELFPLEVTEGTRHLAVVAGLALLAVSRGLWRGKRWSWLLTLLLLLGSALLHLVKGFDWEEAAAAVVLVGLVGLQRNAFQASADPPALTRAFRALGLSLLLVCSYALLGSLVLRTQYNPALQRGNLLRELGARLVLGTGPLQPTTRRAEWFLESFSVIAVAMLGYLLVAFLRPLIVRPAVSSEHVRAHALLRKYGGSSLSYFALAGDKSLYFGERVEGVIAFRVAVEVAVVCGDPIVAPEHLGALLDEFARFCFRHGWELCLYEVGADYQAVYEQLGMRTLKIGEDAWIDLQTFTLKGKPISDIRHAIAKVERDGVVVQTFAPGEDWPQEPDYWGQMQHIASAQTRGDFEMQFSIGRLPAAPDPEACYTLALAADRASVLGFCSWLPIYAVQGWALDVMQRHADAPNGTMEFIIGQTLLFLQARSARWASLGVAPLADVDVSTSGEQSLLQRGTRFLYEHPQVNELYRYKSLFFFKRKFVPAWRSVYLVYDSHLALPRVLYAVLKVHLPGIGAGMITDFLITQSEQNIRGWGARVRGRKGPADGKSGS